MKLRQSAYTSFTPTSILLAYSTWVLTDSVSHSAILTCHCLVSIKSAKLLAPSRILSIFQQPTWTSNFCRVKAELDALHSTLTNSMPCRPSHFNRVLALIHPACWEGVWWCGPLRARSRCLELKTPTEDQTCSKMKYFSVLVIWTSYESIAWIKHVSIIWINRVDQSYESTI